MHKETRHKPGSLLDFLKYRVDQQFKENPAVHLNLINTTA